MDLLEIRDKLNRGYALNDLNLRVTYYSRVSTEHLEQQKSLINQNEHFEQYIRENNNWIYVNGYIDSGITGTSDIKRNNFMKMIEDAKNDKFDLIITKEISRFSRNTLDSIKYTRLLLTFGVAVLFLNDNINTLFADSELRLTIMASMAQDEIRRLSERVKFGMRRAQEKGEILGNNMLYGYIKEKDTGNLKIVSKEAEVVKNVYYMYAIDNISLSEIARTLNDQKITTRQNKKWLPSSISRMIKNPKYKGYYCGKKVEVIDYMTKKIKYFEAKDWIVYKDNAKIPPIISDEVWNLANDKIKNNYKKITKNIDDNIFNNKIYCAIHDVPFYKRYFRKKKKDRTWICSNYLKYGKKNCDSPNIRESELIIIMTEIMKYINIDKEKVIELLLNIYKKSNFSNSEDSLLKKIERNKKDLNLKKDKLLNLYLNNIIDIKELESKIKKINIKLVNIDKEIDKINTNDNDDYIKIEEILKERIKSLKIDYKIMDLLINKIVVKKIAQNEISMKIYLNYSDLCYQNNFYFKRGYDISSTKRYIVKYDVEIKKRFF